MPITTAHVNEFAVHKYTLVRRMIPDSDRIVLLQHALERSKTATMKPDPRVPGTPAAYSDPYMEDLLERLVPMIEQATQLKIFPTYSYFRVYKDGDVLERHTDRQSCEISVSLTLGYLADAPWPLWIDGSLRSTGVELEPGDAIVYRGIDCPHWREAFRGQFAAQVFMHYVDQNGPLAEWKFDKRRHLGKLPMNLLITSTSLRSPQRPDRVLDLTSGEVLQMSPLRAFMWKGFEAEKTAGVIVEQLVTEFGITRSEASVEIMDFISLCEQNNLLTY